jgi:c-di-GMP phosphodiesterase
LNSINHQTTVARQPILDRNLNTYAYELLYRGEQQSQLGFDRGDTATSQVISHTFVEDNLEKVIGNRIAFINMTRNLLISDDPLPFSHEHVVLEILEDIAADDVVVKAVENLVAQGYRIALDDFIFDESLWPLIHLSEIIKIDILALDEQQLHEHVAILKSTNVKLLAEKVETQEQYELCKQLGFDYFQGFFFSRPTLIKDAPLPGNALNILRIVSRLQNPNVDFDEIEELISQDASLSYKLLKLLNSAALGLPKKVDSIKRALVILGFKSVKSWTTLIALSNVELSTPELMTIAMTRAKMCEQIAGQFNCEQDAGFMVGLFSNLDAMMRHEMEELIENLPLTKPVQHALLNQTGELGQLLHTVKLYELGLWDDIIESPLNIDQLGEAYVKATEWTIDAQSSLY